METRDVGLLVVGLGVVAILVGALILVGGLNWFGRLPGDIRYERGSTRVYAPIASMLLISIVLSLVMYVVRRVF